MVPECSAADGASTTFEHLRKRVGPLRRRRIARRVSERERPSSPVGRSLLAVAVRSAVDVRGGAPRSGVRAASESADIEPVLRLVERRLIRVNFAFDDHRPDVIRLCARTPITRWASPTRASSGCRSCRTLVRCSQRIAISESIAARGDTSFRCSPHLH